MSLAAKGGGKVSPEESEHFHLKPTKYDEGFPVAAAHEGELGGKGIPVAVGDRAAVTPAASAPFRGPESPAAAFSSGLEPQHPTAIVTAPDPEAAVLVTVSPTDHEVLK